MKSPHIGGIHSIKVINDQRYVNVVLQSLSALKTTKDIFLVQNFPFIKDTNILRQYSSLLDTLYNTLNDGCSLDIIDTYNEYAQKSNEDHSLIPKPYNFLVYFLQFLDDDCIKALNIQREEQNNIFDDIDSVIENIYHCFQSNKVSLISENYFFSEIMNNNCQKCDSSQYQWKFNKTVKIDMNKYIEEKSEPTCVTDLLKYYTSQLKSTCQNCGSETETQ